MTGSFFAFSFGRESAMVASFPSSTFPSPHSVSVNIQPHVQIGERADIFFYTEILATVFNVFNYIAS